MKMEETQYQMQMQHEMELQSLQEKIKEELQ